MSLAGRPPFATDELDSAYAGFQPQTRYKQPPRDNPNARTSAYNHYDVYLTNSHPNGGTHSKHAASMAPTQSIPQQMPVPLLAPKPGYAAPIAALSMHQPSFPSPAPAPQTQRFPLGINPPRVQFNQPPGAPRLPSAVARPPPPPVAPISVPSTPHPLPPTMTPILPVFARPSKPTHSHDIQWGPEPILRGNSEERLLPRRGEKGDDFWRRFSMVARQESKTPYSQKQSAWLRKAQNDTNRMSRWVWVVGLLLLTCAGLGIGVGWYASHKAPPHQDPTAFGGGDSQRAIPTSSQGQGVNHSSLHVTPTNTVARRSAFPDPLPTPAPNAPIHVMHVPYPHGSKHDPTPVHHRRQYLNRAIM
ncbi:hypothetical protein BJV78DRAFT_1282999 [Lactifluus subvellereus]|nr:hypothetical protein BJV78DRAFT_1282999 [Lactifluus subvellereus]